MGRPTHLGHKAHVQSAEALGASSLSLADVTPLIVFTHTCDTLHYGTCITCPQSDRVVWLPVMSKTGFFNGSLCMLMSTLAGKGVGQDISAHGCSLLLDMHHLERSSDAGPHNAGGRSIKWPAQRRS